MGNNNGFFGPGPSRGGDIGETLGAILLAATVFIGGPYLIWYAFIR